jgi:hypothetical protein
VWSVGDFAFEIGLALAGLLICILGLIFFKGRLKGVIGALGFLVVLYAVLSVGLDVGYQVKWRTPGTVPGAVGSWPPGLEPDSGSALPPVAQSLPATATPVPSPLATREPTATPTITPTSTPTLTPTPTITPSPTPVPLRWRLEYTPQEDRTHTLYVVDLDTKQETAIYSENSLIPVYSAAWSPDGTQILVSARWYTSDNEHGAKLGSYGADGSELAEIFVLDMVESENEMGNALWSPDGEQIALYLQQGQESGVHTMKADGTGLARLPNSEPGEWPRYWTVDGEWIVAITEDGSLYALQVEGDGRLPLDQLSDAKIYDQRYQPWRILDLARCGEIEESWWKCK